MRYCDECACDQKSILKTTKELFILHGHSFEVEIVKATCGECGFEVYDEELLNNAMQNIHSTYKELFGGLTVSEIRGIRGQYPGLGKRPFAKILGIGSASVGRYESESGASMNPSILNIYRELLGNPAKIVDYYNLNHTSLSKRELIKVKHILNPWFNGNQFDERSSKELIILDEEIIENLYKAYAHTSLSGYIEFDFDKLVNMILYFARNGVDRSKLMKLLWFSDFYHFRNQTVSISGIVYHRLKYGPAPKDHDILLAHLQHMDIIKVEEYEKDEGWVHIEIRSIQEFDSTVLDDTEITTLEKIKQMFGALESWRLSECSRDERAWIETENEMPIDYKYAMGLKEI
ncbi:hypothetical protein BK120_14905 [Paenibacillus sp. FSL A5-0031]|uniref:type II toxin-antitoxin system antitoxin SocA domain-containing protein n=1 Tax=Paenibacillus sp. FSL A5-0031 TaxID=1920420 RepID=UPI00096C65A1|nr:type II toxin-antitoxin system antitoxin SocA domain-containing protein [Paenibacillus sp. FSL A5-0031]OME83089.1 hypothetical protein BK120_14905 [Paenibacillus sp. FSL A5-0031]